MTRGFGPISGLFARGGGYKALVERYGVEREPPPGALRRQTVMTDRTVAYKRCVTLAALPEGLYFRVDAPGLRAQPATLIPWTEIVTVEPVRLYWFPGVRLTVGSPKIASLTVYAGCYERLRPYLEGRETSQQ
jgi:hypothetical protein